MLLGLNVIGGDSIVNNVRPSKQTYDKLEFYGNTVIDAVYAKKILVGDSDILNANSVETFNPDETIVISNFENTLESGNLTNSDKQITSWNIRRKSDNESLSTLIGNVAYSRYISTFIDYYPANRTNYTYFVSPVSDVSGEKIEGFGIEGVGIMDFFGWILSDTASTPVQYKFDMDINSENIEVVKDFKLYQNYKKFPAFRFGEMEYKKGKLTTKPYNYNNSTKEYEINKTVLDEVVNFINNGSEKILRNTAGEAWKVVTYSASYKYQDNIKDQPFDLSFEFVQIGEV